MDFRTSRLGTCKHIEAISLAKGGRYVRISRDPQFRTRVYVDYVDGRKVKVSRGMEISDEILRDGFVGHAVGKQA